MFLNKKKIKTARSYRRAFVGNLFTRYSEPIYDPESPPAIIGWYLEKRSRSVTAFLSTFSIRPTKK